MSRHPRIFSPVIFSGGYFLERGWLSITKTYWAYMFAQTVTSDPVTKSNTKDNSDLPQVREEILDRPKKVARLNDETSRGVSCELLPDWAARYNGCSSFAARMVDIN